MPDRWEPYHILLSNMIIDEVYRFKQGPKLEILQLWNGLLLRSFKWKLVGTTAEATQHLKAFEACLQNIRDYELVRGREITEGIIGDWVAVRLCGKILECLDRREYKDKVCTIGIGLA